jgi:hypothetical protein
LPRHNRPFSPEELAAIEAAGQLYLVEVYVGDLDPVDVAARMVTITKQMREVLVGYAVGKGYATCTVLDPNDVDWVRAVLRAR